MDLTGLDLMDVAEKAVLAISGIVFFTAIGIHLWQWIREHGDES